MDVKTYLENAVNSLFDQLEAKAGHFLEVKALEYFRPKAVALVDGLVAAMDAKGVGAGPSQ